MKNLLICSYLAGIAPQFHDFMANRVTQDKEILLIPTAGNVETYTAYLEEGKALLDKSGYRITTLDVAVETQARCQQAIGDAKAICILGGNTFYLLQELKKKQLIEPLRDKLMTGCPYIGESAGGIILTKDIGYSHIMDDPTLGPDLTDTSSLDVINFYPLPHYIEAPFTDSVTTTFQTYHQQLTLVPINNQQAIQVKHTEIAVH